MIHWHNFVATDQLTREEATNLVIEALPTLFQNDHELFYLDANEPCIGHKFAECLTNLCSAYHVDAEYNRDGHAAIEPFDIFTKYGFLRHDEEHEKKRRVYPDVIVHRRQSAINRLVVEIKCSTNTKPADRRYDDEKLKYFTSPQVPHPHTAFHYDVGLFLVFLTGAHVVESKQLAAFATWYENGVKQNEDPQELHRTEYPNPNW